MEFSVDESVIVQKPLHKVLNNTMLLKETVEKIDTVDFVNSQEQLLKRSLSVLLYTFFGVYIRDSLNKIYNLYKKIPKYEFLISS